MPSSAPGAEAGEVSAEDPTSTPEQILAGVLTDPRSVMFAMDEHGFRIALPSGLDLPAHRTLEVAGENRTVVDLVIGDDMLTVVDAWQRTLDTGSSVATVHSRNAPDSALRLTFVDARAPYGVWLGALAPAGYPDSVADATSWVGAGGRHRRAGGRGPRPVGRDRRRRRAARGEHRHRLRRQQ